MFIFKSLWLSIALGLSGLAVTDLPISSGAAIESGRIKLLVVKGADAAFAEGDFQAVLQKWNASIIDANVNYFVIEAASLDASRLRDELLLLNPQAVEIRPDFDRLDFRAFPVDARLPAPAYPADYSRSVALPPPARDAFLLQFSAIPRPDWLDAIKAAGGSVVHYVPQNGYVVLASEQALAGAVSRLPVQLLRLQQPAHKIAEEARLAPAPLADVSVTVLNVAEAVEAVAYLDSITVGEVRPPDTAGDRSYFRVTVATSGLKQLAALPAVVWVETLPAYAPSGEREAHLIAGDTLVTNSGNPPVLQPTNPASYRSWLNLKGFLPNYNGEPTYSSMKVGLLDTGFGNGTPTGHDDFRNSSGASFVSVVNYTSNNPGGSNADCAGHGTMTAGVVAGNASTSYASATRDSGGFGYYMGQGVSPAVGVVSGRIFNYLQGSPGPPDFSPQPWTTIYADLVARGVFITNNSWNGSLNVNDPPFGYNSDAQILDKIVRHAGTNDTAPAMPIFFSAGNDCKDCNNPVIVPATAKNVVTVGATENYNPNTYPEPGLCTTGPCSDNGNHLWRDSPSALTANDFRLKPDFVSPGTAIEAPRSVGGSLACKSLPTGKLIDPTSPLEEQHYWSSGTSFASPGAAGAAVLLHKWFKTKTGASPHPALLKAMLATLAYDIKLFDGNPPTPTGAPPAAGQGFGKVDLTRAFKTDGRYHWNNQANTLTPASPTFIASGFTVKDTSKPVKVTLAWTDAPGDPAVSIQLRNDLDLVVASSTNTHLCAGNNTNPTTRRSKIYASVGPYPPKDRRNNVEQCTFLASELGTTFAIHVTPIAIIADGKNVWAPTTNQQDFALFVENVVGQ